jgi:hypothetical protein
MMHNKCSFKTELIAPCGMICGVCIATKPVTIAKCKIKNCDELKNNNLKYCFKCSKFPCSRIKNMDKRYRTKYNMSIIENLENIKKFGIRKFIKNEETKWTCKRCGGTICCHKGYCYNCGK